VSVPETTGYKILTADQLSALEQDGSFAGSPVDLEDGYIHLSTADQLEETIRKHYAGQDGLQLVAIDLDALGDAVKWEPSRGGALFPHIYGSITLDVVVAYSALQYEPDGPIRLPITG
jgi:uncharacterized protein (DUF952 family)